MGESDAYGYPGCLHQRKGDNYGCSFLDRILNIYKIEPSGFSSTKLLAELIRDTEDMYTAHFSERRFSDLRTIRLTRGDIARGDKKRALGHLRAGWNQETQYSAMFRSGVYLGLAVPALVSGLYESKHLFLGVGCC